MTIHRAKKEIQIECDGPKCNESTEVYDENDFYIMIEEAKSNGWHMKRLGNEWTHWCPSCVKEKAA